ncbi:hypothetical protein GCM10027425_04350 [Alteromonas gracilis]
MATWLVGAGSLFLVLSVVSTMGELNTVAYREDIEDFLSTRGLGLTVDSALSVARGMLFATGAAAAAALVGVVYAARRDKPARIVVSVTAVVVFLAGSVADPLLAAFVAAGATLLWSGPANDWFAGRPIRQPRPLGAGRSRGDAEDPSASDGSPSAATGTSPFAGPTANGPAATGPAAHGPLGSGPTAAPASGRTRRRGQAPQEVVTAALVTATMSAAVVLGMVFDTARYLTNPETLAETYADSGMSGRGISEDMWTAALVVGALLLIGWALGAIGLALMTVRGHSWARILLIVSAATAGLMTLVIGFGQPLALIVAVACAATVWLLLRPAAHRFFSPLPPAQR